MKGNKMEQITIYKKGCNLAKAYVKEDALFINVTVDKIDNEDCIQYKYKKTYDYAFDVSEFDIEIIDTDEKIEINFKKKEDK